VRFATLGGDTVTVADEDSPAVGSARPSVTSTPVADELSVNVPALENVIAHVYVQLSPGFSWVVTPSELLTNVTGEQSDDVTTILLTGSVPVFVSTYVNVTPNGAIPVVGEAVSVNVVDGVRTVTVADEDSPSVGTAEPSVTSLPVADELSVTVTLKDFVQV